MTKQNFKKPLTNHGRKVHPFFDSHIDLDVLAAEQGVPVISNISQLRADFWPENETEDEFLVAFRSWRQQDPP